VQSLVDEFLESYLRWREACARVRTAYERWGSSDSSQRALAFEGYTAAVDWEEQAARVHWHWAERIQAVER
jgi:hypothetical protein